MPSLRLTACVLLAVAMLSTALSGQELIDPLAPMDISGLPFVPSTTLESSPEHPDVMSMDEFTDVRACSPGFEVGGAFYLLKPVFEHNPSQVQSIIPVSPTGTQDVITFDWNYQPASLLWIGWQPEGRIGLRGSWFHFDQASPTQNSSLTDTAALSGSSIQPSFLLPNAVSNVSLFGVGPNIGAPSNLVAGVIDAGSGLDRLSFRSGMSLWFSDIDLTGSFCVGRTNFTLTGGTRIIHLSQNYAMNVSSQATIGGVAATETQQLGYGHNFSGAGPTLGVAGVVPFLIRGLAFYGNARGGVLFGWSRQSTSYSAVVNDPTGTVVLTNPTVGTVNSSQYQTMPMIDLEMGTEFRWEMWCTEMFVRGGVVAQSYFGAGNASSVNGNMMLFGLQIATGVTY